eukprot:jgi/Mesvir1/542/Mv11399-RA.1
MNTPTVERKVDVSFDPLVTKHDHAVHYKQEDDARKEKRPPRLWDNNAQDPYEGEPFEEYINYMDLDYDDFNVTDRLLILFPQVDRNHDNYIDLDEMQDWHVEQALNSSMRRAERELDRNDLDGDGLITLSEYLQDSGIDINEDNPPTQEWESYNLEWIRSSRALFAIADGDSDGKLNITEFNEFLHPEDSNNPRLHQFLRQQEINSRDKDKDGKLNVQEFADGLMEELRIWAPGFGHDNGNGAPTNGDGEDDYILQAGQPRRITSRVLDKFKELDANGDLVITEDEMKPVMESLQPSEVFYAEEQASRVMNEADDDKDGRLTREEMLNNVGAFYHVAYDDDEYADYYHDEF